MENFVTNLYGRHTRFQDYQDRTYFTAPMVMLVEGVHNGSAGALYYPSSELSRYAKAWENTPITLGHPTVNGVGVGVNWKGHNTPIIGFVKNARVENKKLVAEAWIDYDKVGELDIRLHEKFSSDGGILEISTGLFTDNEYSPGHFNGKDFEFVARNHQPDHLALLTDQAGACSVEAGCGLSLNQETQKEHTTMKTLQVTCFGSPVTNNANDGELAMPVMNFEKPCGCHNLVDVVHNGSYQGKGLPLTTTEIPGGCGCGGRNTIQNTEKPIIHEGGDELALPSMF